MSLMPDRAAAGGRTAARGVRLPDDGPIRRLPEDSIEPAVRSLRIEQIDVPRRRVRRSLDRETLGELAVSLADHSQLQPILVRQDGDRYTLIAGERRLEAAKLLGWPVVTAAVHSVDRARAYVLELVENLQREALTPEEEADAYLELIRLNDWGVRELAEAVGRSPSYISRRTRIFEDDDLRTAVVQHGLPISTAEELVAVEDDVLRPTLIRQAITNGWTFSEAREAVRALRELPGSAETAPVAMAESAERGPAWPEAPPAPARGEPSEEPPEVLRPATPTSMSLGRPPGFDRTAKEFLDLLLQVTADDLTDRDKRLLTRIWETIGLLARATPGQRRVLPPLPTR